MPRRSVSSGDGVANVNDSGREDVGSEAASVDHRAKQGGTGEALKMRARLAQASAYAADSSDLEFLADKRVQIDAAGDDVAARLDGRELQAFVAEGVEDFAFDERQLLAVLLARGERARAVEVAVADDATAGAQLDAGVGLHRGFCVSCGEQGFDDAGGAGGSLRRRAGRARWVERGKYEGSAQLVG